MHRTQLPWRALLAFVVYLLFCPSSTVVSAIAATQHGTPESSSFQLVPTPRHLEMCPGRFTFSRSVTLCLPTTEDGEDRFAAGQLSDEIRSALGIKATQTEKARGHSILLGRIGQSNIIRKRLKTYGVTPPDSLGNEGYILAVRQDGILIAANTGAGVFYGVQTLRQLIRSYRSGGAIPNVTITDWPALKYRGWMLDISRGPIPTLAFLKTIVATMAEYKQNCATLYTEHVFRLKSHPEIAPEDGITAEEIAELTSFARRYHVELIGNAQSFGHMENILASPFYDRMRENNWVVSPAREETYTFLKDMYAEIAPAYASKLFHINCDEVTGLGGGPGKRMVDSLGTAEVYAYHINRIADIIRPYGKRLLMWGDIAVGNPQIIARLPKDLIIVSWGYHAAESFDDAILPFKNSGFEFMVAPGVSCWGQVWPNMSNALINISNYIRDGSKLGAIGMMNTVWVDDGENLFHYNWHGLLWGAECSWNPPQPLSGEDATNDREARIRSFHRAFDTLFFGTPGVTETLLLFDSLRTLPVRDVVTDRAVWSSMLEQYPEEISEEAEEDNERARLEAERLTVTLQGLKTQVNHNVEMLDAALFASRRVLFTVKKNIARIVLARAIASGQGTDIARAETLLSDLLSDLHKLKAEYVTLWLRENRGWALDRVLAKYDRLGNQLLDLDKTVLIRPDSSVSEGRRRISLATPFGDRAIYYTTDGSDPTLRSSRYVEPFWIDRSALVRARVYLDNRAYACSEMPVMVHKAVGKLGNLISRYSLYNPAYAAGGNLALLDGLRGSENFSDGRWQGFQGQDLDIVIDLQIPTEIKRISIGLLQQSYSWILMPERVQFWTSADGKSYSLVKEILNSVDPREDGTIIRDVAADFQGLTARFVRVFGKYPGKLPAWHHAAGNDAFVFADEIVIQ
jgi:hexosaminidase